MTREQVLERLRNARAEFDSRVADVPADAFDRVPAGYDHSPKEVVSHVAAYDRLMVMRLRAARRGECTAFDRDRVGWESFNARIWDEAAGLDPAAVLAESTSAFADLLAEVALLADEDLVSITDVTEHLDSAWLAGRALWELIGIDGFEHYPMHLEGLAIAASEAASPVVSASRTSDPSS